jgi:hypothetical protein
VAGPPGPSRRGDTGARLAGRHWCPGPGGCAPPAGPPGLCWAVATHFSWAAVAIRGPFRPLDSILFYRKMLWAWPVLTLRFWLVLKIIVAWRYGWPNGDTEGAERPASGASRRASRGCGGNAGATTRGDGARRVGMEAASDGWGGGMSGAGGRWGPLPCPHRHSATGPQSRLYTPPPPPPPHTHPTDRRPGPPTLHKQTQLTSPRTSFSPCCQPRMLLATHAAFSRPRAAGNALLNPPPARGVLVEPARLKPRASC